MLLRLAMDFRDLLQSEIAAKRRLLEERAGPRKFIRRGDLEAEVTPPAASEKAGVDDAEEKITPECDSRPEEASEEASQGLITEDNNAKAKESGASPTKRSAEELFVGAMETEPISAESLEKDAAKTRTLISLFLRRLIREQGAMLAQRTEEARSSKEGKLATTVHQQCQEHLRPLFKLLRKNALPQDVLERLVAICGCMQQREYVRANDAYLKLAIGNAPWPIGVTAVGIHERSAQEKIKSNQVART